MNYLELIDDDFVESNIERTEHIAYGGVGWKRVSSFEPCEEPLESATFAKGERMIVLDDERGKCTQKASSCLVDLRIHRTSREHFLNPRLLRRSPAADMILLLRTGDGVQVKFFAFLDSCMEVRVCLSNVFGEILKRGFLGFLEPDIVTAAARNIVRADD